MYVWNYHILFHLSWSTQILHITQTQRMKHCRNHFPKSCCLTLNKQCIIIIYCCFSFLLLELMFALFRCSTTSRECRWDHVSIWPSPASTLADGGQFSRAATKHASIPKHASMCTASVLSGTYCHTCVDTFHIDGVDHPQLNVTSLKFHLESELTVLVYSYFLFLFV